MTQWQCYAHPAALSGKTCGHLNQSPQYVVLHAKHMMFCEKCGCTKQASDYREQKEKQK